MLSKKYLGLYLFLFSFLFLLPLDAFSVTFSRLEKIPDSIISLSSGYALVVDKQYQKIYAFKRNAVFSKVFEAPCSTGKNHGSKQVEGDLKTPNGVYFATRMVRNPVPPETYGALAFTLDYPALPDKRAGRNGTNIWIHGTAKPLSPFQSSGCVVLRNSDLQRLDNIIFFNKTPVIIQESINWISQNSVPYAKYELERIMALWNRYYLDMNMKSLDALYLPGAEIKGKKREEFFRRFKSLRTLNDHFSLQPRDVSILRQENTAVILFDLVLAVNNDNSFQGSYNKLTLERVNNRWYIVDESAIATPIATATKTATASTNAAVVLPRGTNVPKIQTTIDNNLKTAANAKNSVNAAANSKNDSDIKTNSNGDITALVNKWAASWKSGDMKRFRNCYAASFKARGMNLNAWVDHKNNVRKNSKNINVRIDNLRVTVDSTTATASFTQIYSSSILKSKSSKKLELKKINGEWKITREII
ncbi:MAG: L,D-transpeptidase [Smithella sp.]